MARNRTALVLGATGGIGGEVARRLLARGWTVRALHRDAAGRAARGGGLTWVQGDALDAAQVRAAARGASLLVHAVNPPGYRNWGALVLPMLESTLAAARETGARVLLPGTVYNYGPEAFAHLDEQAPQRPRTRKGALRVELERRLEAAAVRGEARVLVVRAGDYFGPRAGNSWFSQGLVRPGRPVTSVTLPGAPGVGHAWAYLPDVAETMVRLLEREEALAPFDTFHLEGHWDADGTGMLEAIRRVVGRPALRARRLPWGLLRLASPLVPLFRELSELRPLWQTPVRLVNGKLLGVLGEEPRTPLDVAVRETLVGLGCLAAAPGTGGAAPTPAPAERMA
jgi:nucleoside-diphosphate-sugar epimerase